jgi:MFS family permease
VTLSTNTDPTKASSLAPRRFDEPLADRIGRKVAIILIVAFGWALAIGVGAVLGIESAAAAVLPTLALLTRSHRDDSTFSTLSSRTLYALCAGPYLFFVVGAGAWAVNAAVAKAFSNIARGTLAGIVIGLFWVAAAVFMAVQHHRDLKSED